jgi:CRISPR/Cas system-associated endonuclease/helicase Cas3
MESAVLPFASVESILVVLFASIGTGKTHTIVVILNHLLNALPQKRFLVTAPTHNAVDNILQRFVAEKGPAKTGVTPVRVSG